MQTILSIDAAEPDVYMGLGSAAYALAKADGELQSEEVDTIRRLFENEAHGDLALRSFLIQEYHDESEETAYAFAMRRLSASRHVLDDTLKKHLVWVLKHVAAADPNGSYQAHEWLRRFQRDLSRL